MNQSDSEKWQIVNFLPFSFVFTQKVVILHAF